MVSTKTNPLHFGLYGESDFLGCDFMHCETLSYRTHLHNNIIKEHFHKGLLQIFFLEQGNLDFEIEGLQRLVTGPAIITIPENTLHGLHSGKNVNGKVLTLSTSIVEKLFSNAPDALLQLNTVNVITEFESLDNFKEISLFVERLYHEMNENLPEKKMVLPVYFNLVLSLIYRILKKGCTTPVSGNPRTSRYFRAFQNNVKQWYSPMKTMTDYAKELSITPVHLNRICHYAAGKSAMQVVHDFFILEAEIFLKHTNMHVSEIAYQLNFEDPAYFSRFFKKYVGVSPRQYREKV